MKRIAILTLQYYRILLVYNPVFTLACAVFALFGFGELNIVVLFLAKVSGFWLATAIHYYSAGETYFYFRNAGYRMRRVIVFAFLMDLLIFLIVANTYYAIQNIKG